MENGKELQFFDLKVGDHYVCVNSEGGDFKKGKVYSVVVSPITKEPSIISESGTYRIDSLSLFKLANVKSGRVEDIKFELGEKYTCTYGYAAFTECKVYEVEEDEDGYIGLRGDNGYMQHSSTSTFELLKEPELDAFKGYLCFDKDGNSFFYASKHQVNKNADHLARVYEISGKEVLPTTVQTKVFFK